MVDDPDGGRLDQLRAGPARSPESSDWRFAVLVLVVLLLATLVTTVVLYLREASGTELAGNLASALVGALIVVIGRRVL